MMDDTTAARWRALGDAGWVPVWHPPDRFMQQVRMRIVKRQIDTGKPRNDRDPLALHELSGINAFRANRFLEDRGADLDTAEALRAFMDAPEPEKPEPAA